MAATKKAFVTPYTPAPGSSTPSANVTPEEGTSELWGFFWLSIASSTIVAVAGVLAWVLVHH